MKTRLLPTLLAVVCCLSFGLFAQVTFERLLQSTGLTLYSMISQVVGASACFITMSLVIWRRMK